MWLARLPLPKWCVQPQGIPAALALAKQIKNGDPGSSKQANWGTCAFTVDTSWTDDVLLCTTELLVPVRGGSDFKPHGMLKEALLQTQQLDPATGAHVSHGIEAHAGRGHHVTCTESLTYCMQS